MFRQFILRSLCVCSCLLCITIISPRTCFADNPERVIHLYQNEYFSDITQEKAFNWCISQYYLSSKKEITLSIYKKVKPAYMPILKAQIYDWYQPPFYTPDDLWNALTKEPVLYISVELSYNFRNRSVFVIAESIRAENGQTLIVIPYDETLQYCSGVYDIDEDYEYGTIANMAIEYAENAKDTYFNPNTKRPQAQYQTESERTQALKNAYMSSFTDNFTRLPFAEDAYGKKSIIMRCSVNKDSFRLNSDGSYEVWYKVDCSNLNVVIDDNRKVHGPIKYSYIYARVHPKKKYLENLAEYDVFQNGDTTYTFLKEPEIWTVIDDAYFVNGMLEACKDLSNK